MRTHFSLRGGFASHHLSVLSLLALTSSALAQTTAPSPAGPLVAGGLSPKGDLRLPVNRSAVLTTSRPYARVSVAEPDIVDFNGIGPNKILVTAKKPGATQILVWDQQDHSQSIEVIALPEIGPIREQFQKLFPNSKIDISMSDDTVILTGRVPNLTVAEQAASLAVPYGKRVVNLLEVGGGQQVLLQVRFAEVSRSATDALGVNLGFTDGTSFGASNVGLQAFGTTDVNNASQLALHDPSANSSITLFGKGVIGNTAIAAVVSALRQNNLLRILAEPNLIATSGQEASFLAGGEFPIPVPQGGSGINATAITIDYKEFGVRLKFVPVVLGDGKVRLQVAPEVSDLDFTTAVRFGGFVVPGLTTRRVSTTIELAEGQTFAIAGLLNNSVAASKDVTPLLGDIPILGILFRSSRYQRKETELVVLVTPHLVSPMNPGEVPLLPGEKWRHPSEAQLFLNADLGGPITEPNAPPRPYIGRRGFAAPPSTTTVQ